MPRKKLKNKTVNFNMTDNVQVGDSVWLTKEDSACTLKTTPPQYNNWGQYKILSLKRKRNERRWHNGGVQGVFIVVTEYVCELQPL